MAVFARYVLRNYNSSSDARYLAADVSCNHLVEVEWAMKFHTVVSAEKFLRNNPEFTGFRVERVK